MAFLHHAEWRELAPDFEARKLLLQTVDLLDGHNCTSAIALKHVRDALARLHPVTQDPEACAEYEARLAGTYEDPHRAQPRPRHGFSPDQQRQDPRDHEIKELRAQLEFEQRARLDLLHPRSPEG